MQDCKTSEDGKVDGIKFTITGNGVNQTVTTANGGKFQLDNLMPGVYTVTEQSIDKYVPQEVHRVTIVAGQVATVNFNNVLKRGNLQVIKSSEDNLVDGVKFHLYGTSLAGIAVDEYAVTDKMVLQHSKMYLSAEVHHIRSKKWIQQSVMLFRKSRLHRLNGMRLQTETLPIFLKSSA